MLNKYKILVNKENIVPDNIQEQFKFITVYNEEGHECLIEKKTYNAYLKLKKCIEKSENIIITIDDAYRSTKEQKEVYDKFVQNYGIDYANLVVAPVGCSEHHTGLVIDLAFRYKNEDFFDENEEIEKSDMILKNHIYKYLSKFGFILRYPKNKEEITGYPYEPWHIRYVGKNIAKKISKLNITLEEYLKI